MDKVHLNYVGDEVSHVLFIDGTALRFDTSCTFYALDEDTITVEQVENEDQKVHTVILLSQIRAIAFRFSTI